MSEVILDTNFLLGLVDEKDKWHSKALEVLAGLREQQCEGIVFDCVANELISVIGKRLEEGKREDEFEQVTSKALQYLAKDRLMQIYPLLSDVYDDVVGLVISKRGKLNFHDALMALAAKKHSLTYIASFDSDFDEIEWLVRIREKEDCESIRNVG